MVRLILILSLISSSAFATTVTTNDGTVCDFSKIVKNKDGTFTYPENLHKCVGKIINDGKAKDAKIADQKKAIDLYTLTIQTDEQRIQNWIQTSTNLEGRVEKVNDLEKKNEWLYFGLGVLTTAAAAYAGEKLVGH
jgi:hypothetical protein